MGPPQIWNYQLIGPTHIRNTMTIPILRRRSRTVSLSTIGGMLSDGIAAINETIEPRAQFWDEWNKTALEDDNKFLSEQEKIEPSETQVNQ